MAIRIFNIKIKDKRIKDDENLNVASLILELLAEYEVDCDIQISRYYNDRWYTLEEYKKLLKRGR